jgi:hypothetical protein
MADIRGSQSDSDSDDNRPVVAELCKIVWLAFSPAGIIFSGAAIWKQPPWTYSVRDGVFWGMVVAALVARLLDIRLWHGSTTENRPATMADWWWYSAKVVVFAAAIWGLAQSFQA